MNKIDYTRLSGEDLFYYFTNDHPDKDYSSIISMLPIALLDIESVYKVLERSVKENKIFVAVYPGQEETDTSKMEYVGSISDGELYLK